MNLLNKRILLLISIFVTIFIIYRYHQIRSIGYNLIPTPEILDEVNYAWQGVSIQKTGIPTSWSTFTDIPRDNNKPISGHLEGFDIYEAGKAVNISNLHDFSLPIYIVTQLDYGIGKRHIEFMAPFFDHPPIGGLILSIGANKNATSFEDITIAQTRSVQLVVAIITTILIFTLAILLTDNPFIAVLAVLIYSAVPTFLLSSRLAFLENISSPFILGYLSLLLINRRLLKNSSIYLLTLTLSGFIAGITCLIKESSAGFLIGTIVVLILTKSSKKELLLFIISASIPIIGYIIWGLYLSPRVFLQVFLGNSSRGFFGALNFGSMLTSLKFQGFPYDGWWTWGFISLLIVAIKDKRFQIITIPIISHLLLLLLMGGLNYPWYYLILVPFFAIISSIVVSDLLIKPNLVTGLAFLIIPLSSSLYWGREVLNHSSTLIEYRLLLISFIGLLILRLVKEKQKALVFLWIFYFLIILTLNFKWSSQAILYILGHWGNLPTNSLLGNM